MTPPHCEYETQCIFKIYSVGNYICGRTGCIFDTRQTPAPAAPMTEEQRKYILSFHEEDPLLMAYIEGQKHPSQKEVATIRNQTLDEAIAIVKLEWKYAMDNHNEPEANVTLGIIQNIESLRTPSTKE